jgi:thiosulfate/3-mercaptopyruvate sulfurtransferase
MSSLVKQGLLDWRLLDTYHLCMKRNHLKTGLFSTRSLGRNGACRLASVLLTVVGVGAAVAAPSDLLKSTDWLAANLNRPDVRIVDLRYGIEYYWQAHVPGAVHLYPDALTWPENGVPSKPIPPDAFAQLLGHMGITDTTTVVAYSEVIDSLSPYLTWMLDYVGHKRQTLIVGELDRWRAEGRVLNQDFPRIQPAVYKLPAKLNESIRVRLTDVKAALGDKKTVLLDVRSPAMYSGEAGYTKRRGHIPGAINRPWLRDLAGDYTWRDSAELKKEYEQLGVTPDKRIIIYCSKGYRSTTAYVTLKHVLGYPNVAVYDGSFSEWSDAADTPVATGPK